jgi:Tfp pilus assembly protein PilO
MATTQKRRYGRAIITAVIALVLVADVALAVENWRLSLSPAASMDDQIRALRRQEDLISLDRRNADNIKRDLPAVQKQCDDFFQQELRPMEGGYSAISADLGSIAKDSGLQINSTRFKQKDIDKHGVEEISIGLSMEGPYPSLVSFINSLERSNNFYVLDSLTLDSAQGGTLRLNLELRTYFRS